MSDEEPSTATVDAWSPVRQLVAAPTRQRVARLVDHHAPTLAELFYREMFADPKLAPLLSLDLVNRRLNGSMMAWLRTLFDPASDTSSLDRLQRHVGEVHARIGVSHASVGAAGRVLKRAIAAELRAQPDVQGAAAIQYVYELIDIAIDAMTDSLSHATARLTRSDESYRLHLLTQNLRTERERQKTHLVEWIQQLLMRHYWDDPVAREAAAAVPHSPFELWVEHKAALLFEDGPELQALRHGMQQVTAMLLPALRAAREQPALARATVARIHEEAAVMKQLLGTLFDRASASEDGRDPLTRLLNRRFVPAIIKREIGLSQAGGRPFALLRVDIDGFTHVAATLGIAPADLVLAQIADTLSECVRASDFVFRIGDDQFLVLLVEADRPAALEVAEGMRHTMEALRLRTTAELAPQITVSIGVAAYEGHPDYEHLLRRAEAALRSARAGGGNRVALAGPDA